MTDYKGCHQDPINTNAEATMQIETEYGRKGGVGPNTGKKAAVYQVTLPDGTKAKKRVFNPRGGDTLIATGFMPKDGGKPIIAIWENEPAWEGEFGRLVAIRIN